MKTSSLRLRVTATTLAVLALALTGFAVAVTVDYQRGLERDLRKRLTGGALALSRAPGSEIKQLVSSLALEGIEVSLPRAPRSVTRQVATAGQPAPAAAPFKPPKHPAVHRAGDLLVIRMPVSEGPSKGPSGEVRPETVVTATLTASQSGVDRPVHQLMLAELIAGLTAITLAALLLLWGMRAALAPLAHVGRVAARIAAGDRRQRLNPARRNTELGRMAASFDEMVGALDAAVEQANRSEAAMRRFLADASHELRTPITALHATIETLLREQPLRPERDALEAQIARESARLGTLVDDLLSLARLEGNQTLRRERVDLGELAENGAAETRAGLAQVVIDVSRVNDLTVTGDPDALSRALRNLLENATAATQGAGHLRIEAARSDGDVILRVRDDGPGVPPDQRSRIFDDFVRVGGAGRPGAGLGLAIVRRIAEQHRGEIICEDVDRGASFVLKIPASL